MINRYKANTQEDLRFSLILTCGMVLFMSSVMFFGSVLSKSFGGMLVFGIVNLSMLQSIKKLRSWETKEKIGIGNQTNLNLWGTAKQIMGR